MPKSTKSRAHFVLLTSIYRVHYKHKTGNFAEQRFMLVFPMAANDARLLIWACEKHLARRWPVINGDYSGSRRVTRNSKTSGIIKVKWQPPDGLETLVIARADQPFTSSETQKMWMGVPTVVVQ